MRVLVIAIRCACGAELAVEAGFHRLDGGTVDFPALFQADHYDLTTGALCGLARAATVYSSGEAYARGEQVDA